MRKHVKVFRKQIKAADEAIETLHRETLAAREKKIDTLIPNFEAGLYLAIVLRDLSTTLIQMIYARSLWERRLCVRHMSVLLYETGVDVPNLTGHHKLRKVLQQLDEWKDIEEILNSASKKFRTAYKANRNYLKNIRNNAAAHYDKNVIVVIETIQDIDPTEILSVVTEIVVGLNEIMVALTFAVKQSGKHKNLFKYAIRNNSEN